MSTPAPDHGVPNEAMWDALAQNPAVGVSVVSSTGEVLFTNPRAAEMFLGGEPKDIIGKTIADLFPPEWASERMAILAEVAKTGQPVVIRHIRRGVQVQSTISPMECGEDTEEICFLVITHYGEHDTLDQEFQVIESKLADFGPLDVLTRRELEVLALIKHGMTLDEIAGLLHRSRKTIDNHRTSIAKKLGESSRVRLAQIAEAAGLELKDAVLRRTATRRDD